MALLGSLPLLLASCGSHRPVAPAVIGRHIQQPWWLKLPDPAIRPSTSGTTPPSWVLPADALFDTGRATLRTADLARLQDFATRLQPWLKELNGVWVVAGATDSRGTSKANHDLGLRRAQAVVDVLVNAGIDPGRLEIESWGESRPVQDESGPDRLQAQALNRRVEIVPSPPDDLTRLDAAMLTGLRDPRLVVPGQSGFGQNPDGIHT